MKTLFRILMLGILSLALLPGTLQAQASDWRERPTTAFTILYIEGSEAEAERYAGFADQIYEEVTGAFGHRVATPVVLRLYPTLERYYEANPRARGITGIVAHADYRRNEVVVVLPQTETQTEEEVQNNVRHELTHIIAAELSENRLNPGFQEGLAQYMEAPAPERERKLELLRTAVADGQLLPWSAFDNRELIYSNPDLSYPQTFSVVSFLAQRTSFANIRTFLSISASSSGYRSALERTFGESPETLEGEWLAWLPAFLSNQASPGQPATYDLQRAEQLLADGNYTSAVQELEAALAGLQAAGLTDQASQAEQLLARGRTGQQADSIAQQARDALLALDYTNAEQLAANASQTYQAIADQRQQNVLAEYIERAQRGRKAEQVLQQARLLADAFRYPQARALADTAAAEYVMLGDRARAAEALNLRSFLDQRQSFLGGLLLLLGTGGIALSIARRMLTPEVEPW